VLPRQRYWSDCGGNTAALDPRYPRRADDSEVTHHQHADHGSLCGTSRPDAYR